MNEPQQTAKEFNTDVLTGNRTDLYALSFAGRQSRGSQYSLLKLERLLIIQLTAYSAVYKQGRSEIRWTRLTVLCETKRNETKRNETLCETKRNETKGNADVLSSKTK